MLRLRSFASRDSHSLTNSDSKTSKYKRPSDFPVAFSLYVSDKLFLNQIESACSVNGNQEGVDAELEWEIHLRKQE